jgi:hypothetical protein
MGLHVIVTYLDRKRLSARVIHDNIVATLGPISCGTAQSRATFMR